MEPIWIDREYNKITSCLNSAQASPHQITNNGFELLCQNQILSTYYNLCSMGLGLQELKYLTNTIREIAAANNLREDEALKKFLSDVEKDYDKILGFEIATKRLKEQKKKMEDELPGYKSHLIIQTTVTTSICYIKSKGLTDSDIIGMSQLVHYLVDNNLLYDYEDSDIVRANPGYFFIQGLLSIKNLRSEIIRLIVEIEKYKTKLKDLRKTWREEFERHQIEEISRLNLPYAHPERN